MQFKSFILFLYVKPCFKKTEQEQKEENNSQLTRGKLKN